MGIEQDQVAFKARSMLHEEPEKLGADRMWTFHSEKVDQAVAKGRAGAQSGRATGSTAHTLGRNARERSEQAEKLPRNSAHAHAAKEWTRRERERLMSHQLRMQEVACEKAQHDREMQPRMHEIEMRRQDAQKRAAKATQHRKSLGVKGIAHLYMQVLQGDLLAETMFVLKQDFFKAKAVCTILREVLTAWALYNMCIAVRAWRHAQLTNRAYMTARLEAQRARRQVRKYGDEIFKLNVNIEAIFPVDRPTSPQWGGPRCSHQVANGKWSDPENTVRSSCNCNRI